MIAYVKPSQPENGDKTIKYGKSGGRRRRYLRKHSHLFHGKQQTRQKRDRATGLPRGADNGAARWRLGMGGGFRGVFFVPHCGRHVLFFWRVSRENVPRSELLQEQGVTGHGDNHWSFLSER